MCTRFDCLFYSREICLMEKHIFQHHPEFVVSPSEIWSESSLIQQNQIENAFPCVFGFVLDATTNQMIFSICFMKSVTMNLWQHSSANCQYIMIVLWNQTLVYKFQKCVLFSIPMMRSNLASDLVEFQNSISRCPYICFFRMDKFSTDSFRFGWNFRFQ